jgi:hypothetical protein
MSGEWSIPPPCIIITTAKNLVVIGIIVVFLSYVIKALYMMHSNNETLSETLMHLSFWLWDVTFFFYAIIFVMLIYSCIISGYIVAKCLRSCIVEEEKDEERNRTPHAKFGIDE